jgi:hypothetical protein
VLRQYKPGYFLNKKKPTLFCNSDIWEQNFSTYYYHLWGYRTAVNSCFCGYMQNVLYLLHNSVRGQNLLWHLNSGCVPIHTLVILYQELWTLWAMCIKISGF